jgi:long-subunit fatty acid transport protein
MRIDYPNESVRDANRWVLGLGTAHAYSGDGPIAFGGLYFGEEDERNGGVPHLGHKLWGARIGGQWQVQPRVTLFATGSYERRDYNGAEPFFLTTRKDDQYNVTLGAHFTPARNWRVTPQIALTRNESNIVTNDYRREIYSITVRRDF